MENVEKFDRRGKSLNKNKLRNLPQYRDKTEEELDLIIANKEVNVETSKELEKRIEEKLIKFSEDYDLSDLKENDKATLRAMIQAIIALEDYEQLAYKLRLDGVTSENILAVDKVAKVMEGLRKSISDFQNDLAITRKHRKSDQETSVLAYIESLKQKAREFYESRMSYIFCDKCNTLLGTIWTLYPEENNKIQLVCMQKDKTGNPCGNKVTVSTKELLEKKGTNNREIIPDSLL